MHFFGKDLPVFKAALHNHSTVSDGQYAPQEIIKLYADNGFEVFAFTDHKKTNPINTYDSCNMTLISGIELHPAGPHGTIWHLLALDVPQDFPGEFATAQAAIDAVNSVNGAIFCAHPAWCGITSRDIAELNGLAGIEVYNSSCRYIGKENSETIWNELTDMHLIYPALAVDDTHTSAELFGGWTMIAAADRQPETIMQALKTGSFYSTQGPEFTRLSFQNGVFEAEFSEVEEAILIGEKATGYTLCQVDVPARGDYRLTTSMQQDISKRKLPDELRFRCRIKDVRGRYAWSPVFEYCR